MADRAGRDAGTVLASIGGVYQVELDSGNVVDSSLRGRLKLEQRTGDRVVVGDRVHVQRQDDGEHTIEAVDERRSLLARSAPGKNHRRAKVIVANIDQVVAVFAAALPEPRLRMLDRFLVLAEANALPAAIILNKSDLADARPALRPYIDAGYPVLFTSVKQRAGLDQVRDRLCGHWSVLTGPSGVGKSSLLNVIQPGLGLAVGDVSETAQKGRHTTVSARLIRLDCGGYVADTPGLRELGLWGVDSDTLPACFPEFRLRRDDCRFGHSCSHSHEPDCAVRAAVSAGEIDAGRYRGYLAMREGDAPAGSN